MDGIALRSPDLTKIEAGRVKVGDIVLKDGKRKKVTGISRYRTKSRRWVTLTFEDGRDLAVPRSQYLLGSHELTLEVP